MFSLHTYVSLAMQMARLVPDPTERFSRHAKAVPFSGDCCGLCPLCGEYVHIQFLAPNEPEPCPRCGQSVRYLEPLGPA